MRCTYRVVRFLKLVQQIDEYVRVLMSKVSTIYLSDKRVRLRISRRGSSTRENGCIHASTCPETVFENSFPLSAYIQNGRTLVGFEHLGSLRTD